MRGKRVGLATDALSVMWSSRSSQLALALASPSAASGTAANPAAATLIAQMTIARDDARNYIVLGDPATRASMGAAALERARDHFDQRRVIDTTLRTYERLLRARGLGVPVTSPTRIEETT